MKIIKRSVVFVVAVILGLATSTLVTVYGASLGEHTTQTEQHGCQGVTYVAAGFPIRDIAITEYDGGECGMAYIENGYTGINTLIQLLNWAFWSGIIFCMPRLIRKFKSYAHTWN